MSSLRLSQRAGNLLSAIRGGAPRRGRRHPAGAVSGRLRHSPFLSAPHRAGHSLLLLLLDGIPCASRLYRVLLHARPRARVQRDSGGGHRGRLGIAVPGWDPAMAPVPPHPIVPVAQPSGQRCQSYVRTCQRESGRSAVLLGVRHCTVKASHSEGQPKPAGSLEVAVSASCDPESGR